MALVLQRDLDQAVIFRCIEGDIKVKIFKEPDGLKLFIDAPKSVLVLREELLDQPKQEKK